MRRAPALVSSALLLAACSEGAKPTVERVADVRAEFALLRAGLPLKDVKAVCAEEGQSGCARLGVSATSTSSPDQLQTRLTTELQRQRWKVLHSSCRESPRQCGVAANKLDDRGLLTLNFTAMPEASGSTSVRISVFYP